MRRKVQRLAKTSKSRSYMLIYCPKVPARGPDFRESYRIRHAEVANVEGTQSLHLTQFNLFPLSVSYFASLNQPSVHLVIQTFLPPSLLPSYLIPFIPNYKNQNKEEKEKGKRVSLDPGTYPPRFIYLSPIPLRPHQPPYTALH